MNDQLGEWQRSSDQMSTPRQSRFVNLVLATGIVETKRSAEYVLLGIAFIGVLFTFYMLFVSVEGSGAEGPGIDTFKNAPRQAS